MRTRTKLALLTSLGVLTASVQAATITVNTADNTDFSAGMTNLVTAINLLNDGDTINFGIPGSGVHRLITPPPVLGVGGGGGYPEITKNDVTIDGFSQSGSSANTATILATNNAVYTIVLDSTADGTHVWDITGFGTSESGVFVVSGHRFHLQGVSMVSAFGGDTDASPKIYGVAFGRGATNGWISGCWLGVDADGTTVNAMNNAVSAYGNSSTRNDGIVIGVKAGSATPRAEQNVICAGGIPLAIEGKGPRICGNRIGVLPDGKTSLNYDDFTTTDAGFCALIEVGRRPGGTLIGTDGDGVNDAEERNIFGAVNLSGDNAFVDFYGTGGDSGNGAATNIVFAGNYFGVGIDGNPLHYAGGGLANCSQRLMNGLGNGTPIRNVRIGSDFDGVSDALEGNVIHMNYDFNTLYPNPPANIPPLFMGIDAGERVALRGNVMIGNNQAPYSFASGDPVAFTNIESRFMDTTGGNIIPILTGSTSGTTHLTGTCVLGISNTVDHLFYTNIVLDVYVADPEGLADGAKFELPEIGCHGFPQGLTYLTNYVVDGPLDLNGAPGAFDFHIFNLGLAPGTLVTVVANYSADPPGTHNGRTHSSNFSDPLALGITQAVNITSIVKSGGSVTITWTGGTAPYNLQAKQGPITGSWVKLIDGITTHSVTVPISGAENYFQICW